MIISKIPYVKPKITTHHWQSMSEINIIEFKECVTHYDFSKFTAGFGKSITNYIDSDTHKHNEHHFITLSCEEDHLINFQLGF